METQEQQRYETPTRFNLGRLTKSPEAEKLLTKEEGGLYCVGIITEIGETKKAMPKKMSGV